MSIFATTLIMKNLQKYLNASKSQKQLILDMLQEQTGLHRKSLIRKLNKEPSKKNLGGSKPKYNNNSIKILQLLWESRDFICAELLHGQIDEGLRYLIDENRLSEFSEKDIELIRFIPLGTLKNKLRTINLEKGKGAYYYRRSSTNLKKAVPISTNMNTSVHAGYVEIDFVDHNGGDSSGKYARTLCAVDVYTQMISRYSVRGRIEDQVQRACNEVLEKIPFPLHKLHSDNESALLNSLINQQASHRGMMISRSRSYQKQDNGHVEQKNGDKIRRLVGYRRYDTDEQVALLNHIYALDDFFQNHFIPSMRLIKKIYDAQGKLVRKEFDKAKTPYQRVLEDKTIASRVKFKLVGLHKELNPIELKENRDNLIRRLRSSR